MKPIRLVSLCFALLFLLLPLCSCDKEEAKKQCVSCGSSVLNTDSFCANCGAKVDGYDIGGAATPNSKKSTTTSWQSFEEWTEDYWELRSSRLEEEAKTSTTMQPTTTSTETTRQTTTRTTTRTTAPSRTETTTVTTTTTVPKTTRTATQDELDIIYDMVYNEVMAEFNKYAAEQEAYIADIEDDIDDLTDRASDYYSDYQSQLKPLREKYAAMGMLNSGAYTAAVKNLESQYKANVAPLSEKIDKLEEELAQAEQDYADAEAELETNIWDKYIIAVEEFQKATLS